MRAHYLQHVPFEGLGSIEGWLLSAGFEITSTKFYETPDFPGVDEIDLLIVMGGPMSVNDEKKYSWLKQEKNFIKNAILSGMPVLGICLGAQLIAGVMGAEVYPNSEQEIGWFPIYASASENNKVFQFPGETEVFHWHGETFNLPDGAVCIAGSNGCKHQAFQIGSCVIGLQFHLETTPDSAQLIVENCRNELVEGKYIQSETELLSATKEKYTVINSLMASVLEYLYSGSG